MLNPVLQEVLPQSQKKYLIMKPKALFLSKNKLLQSTFILDREIKKKG